ncbi:hypothetical protein BU15DRAFT_64144 [Melanogaster broomeanus]|nr:hypothetical protein BU15DRAFT_64144 [Melanogaster broomeanus]
MSTSDPFELMWGPTYIGFSIASASYGATIGQLIFYLRAFPCDKLYVRLLRSHAYFDRDSLSTVRILSYGYLRELHELSSMFLADVVALRIRGFIALPEVGHLLHQLYHFRGPAVRPRSFGALTYPNSALDSFYAHRVWIISDRNRFLTVLVVWSLVLSRRQAKPEFYRLSQRLLNFASHQYLELVRSLRLHLFSSVFIDRFSPAVAIAEMETKFTKFISRLNLVFMRMGLLSFVNALATVIFYYVQYHRSGQYLVFAPGLVLSKTYVNCMLAV